MAEFATLVGHREDVLKGNDSPAFGMKDSVVWGVLWLLYRMNQPASGGGAWDMRDCSWKHLLGGAQVYNVGDEDYKDKVDCVLRKIGAKK
jgi:hypothetical protein